MIRNIILILLISFCIQPAKAQTPLQSFSGIVLDKETKYPMPSVDIRLLNTSKRYQIATDFKGYFQIRNIPVGTYDIFIRYMGFKTVTLKDVRLQAGETPFVLLELEQEVNVADRIEVREYMRTLPSTSLNYVHVDAIHPTIQKKWAGNFGDKTGGLSFVPGVIVLNDFESEFSANGAPSWANSQRVNGAPVANLRSTTGFSENNDLCLVNDYGFFPSDFYSGAAGASSNGMGVSSFLDLQMKLGNFREHQFSVQGDLLGGSVSANGPLHGRTSVSRASYRVHYRHSNLNYMGEDQSPLGELTPRNENISFLFNLPTKKSGTIKVFGTSAWSDYDFTGTTEENQSYSLLGFTNNTIGRKKGVKNVFGVSHLKSFDRGKINLQTNMSISRDGVEAIYDSLDYTAYEIPYQIENHHAIYDFNTNLTYRFNVKSMLKVGLETMFNSLRMTDQVEYRPSGLSSDYTYYRSDIPKRNLAEYRLSGSYQLKVSNKLKLNSGFQYKYYDHMRLSSFDPSIGAKYEFGKKAALSVQASRQSQLPAYSVLYGQYIEMADQSLSYAGRELDYILSDQICAEFEFNLGKSMYTKISAFYHQYDNIPVANDSTSLYSYFNVGRETFPSSEFEEMVAAGKANTFGGRFSFEKSLSNYFYFMANGSYVISRYTPRDGFERESAWDTGFSGNGILGFAFPLGDRVSIDMNARATSSGGPRFRAIDLESSIITGHTVYDKNIDYKDEVDRYLRVDARFAVLWNVRKFSQEFAIDIRNVTDQQNVLSQYYDPIAEEIKFSYQSSFFPMFSYRVCF